MEISIEILEGLHRRMRVVLPATQINEAVETELKKLMPTVKLKGFRPGKVPYEIVKRQFTDSVRHDVELDLINKTLQEALKKKEQEFTVAGGLQVTARQKQPDKSLMYEVDFEIYPRIDVHDLQGVKLEKLKSEVTDDDVELVVQRLRQHATVWQEVARAAQTGDQVIIDFAKEAEDGVVAADEAAKNFKLILGSNKMILGFEKGLIGSSAGQELTLPLTFPENYSYKKLAGTTANFEIKVHKVEEPLLPEVNAEFAKQLGVADGVEKLREEIHNSILREIEKSIHSDLKNKILGKWLALNDFAIPQTLVDLEIEKLQQQMKQEITSHSGTQKNIDLSSLNEHFTELAKRRIALGLLLNEFVKREQLKVDPGKLEAKINEIARGNEHPQEMADRILNSKEQLEGIKAAVLEDQVVEKLLETAEIEEKFIPCQELTNLHSQKGG